MRSLPLVMVFVIACGHSAAAPSASPTPLPTLPPLATPAPSPTPSATATPTRTASPPPTATKAAPPLRYVAIGASDTVGVGALDPVKGSWPSRIAALLPSGSTYRNLGVSGSLAAQAVREQLPTAIAENPDLVTVWLAVNDLDAQVSPADLGAALTTIADALVSGTPARIFIGNVPDLRAVPAYAGADQAALLARMQAYNAAIAGVAARRADRVVVVDLFAGSAGLTTQLTVSSDGFHPSDAGYALIARRFADAMRESGIPLR